jgi:acyl carrier protein
VAPRTPTEQTLAAIWADVLHRDRVGVDDNFFELGGHSLLAMQVVARVGSALQAEISIARFFQTPTITGLIDILADAVGGRAVLDAIAETYMEIVRLPAHEVAARLANADEASDAGTVSRGVR